MSYYKFLIKYSLYDKELNILKQKNIDLEDKISRLSTNSLDLDYLDEQLILNTGKIAKDELVINLNN